MLVLTSSIQAYFREALDSAMRSSQISFTEPVQVYIVHLLNEFSRSERAFAGADPKEPLTLAELLERALAADDREALRIYRHLGDTSLYLLGFFREAQQKGIVSETYYRDMGALAYSHASGLSRGYTFNNALLFQELSDRFGDVVTIMATIAHYGKEKPH